MKNKLKEQPRWSALLAFVAVFAVVVFVAGCGSSDSDEPGDNSGTEGTNGSGTPGSSVAGEHDEDEDDDDHNEEGGHDEDEGGSEVSADSFGDVASVWAQVMDLQATLDEVIASKDMKGVHHAAFEVRDHVELLTEKSHDLSKDDLARLAKGISTVVSLASELDEAGDSGNQEKTEALNEDLHTVLNAIAEIYPEGALK